MAKHIALTLTVASLLACGGEGPARTPTITPASPPGASTRPEAGDLPVVEPPGEAASRQDGAKPRLAAGQTLYVPVYSHVCWGPKARPFDLACTLSIRNVDLACEITVTTVDYYDTAGLFVRSHLEAPVVLRPLETVDYYIEEQDTTGGSGANFVVRWRSERPVNVPVLRRP